MILCKILLKFWRRIFCFFGIHKINKARSWSRNKRLEACYYCDYKKWVVDTQGYQEDLDFRIKSIRERRRVITEKYNPLYGMVNSITGEKYKINYEWK